MKRFLIICTATVLAFGACGRPQTSAERAEQLGKEAFEAIEAAAAEESDSLRVIDVAAEISDCIKSLDTKQESEFGEVFAAKFYECSYLSGYGIEHTREQLLAFITTYLGIGENPDTAFGHAVAIMIFSQCIFDITEDPADQAELFVKELFETFEIGQVYQNLQYELLENIGNRLGEYINTLAAEQGEAFGEAFATKLYEYSDAYGYGEDFASDFLTEFANSLTDESDTEASDEEPVMDTVSIAN